MVMLTNNRTLFNEVISKINEKFKIKIVDGGTKNINKYDIL